MSSKVLVADDSSTVQKVVEITLANADYELVQAYSEEELLKLVENDSFDLILLDFSLSEDKDGYKLSRLIKKESPSSRVLAMLGTFDTVDDDTFGQSGIDDKIVKPFESGPFIQKCRELIEKTSTDSLHNDENLLGSEWVVDSPQADGFTDFDEEEDGFEENHFTEMAEHDHSDNALDEELKGWGMEVPGVIDGPSEVMMPAKMSGEDVFVSDDDEEEEATLFPEQDDLEYPSSSEEKNEPSSKLVSLDELLVEGEDREEEEERNWEPTNPGLPSLSGEIPRNLELEEAVEGEISADDFWATDSGLEETFSNPILDNDQPLEESGPGIDLADETVEESNRDNIVFENKSPVLDFNSTPEASADNSFHEDQVVEKLKTALTPVIEEMVRKYAQNTVEKVAWDVIPDLAENLIREEIQNLSREARENSFDS